MSLVSESRPCIKLSRSTMSLLAKHGDTHAQLALLRKPDGKEPLLSFTPDLGDFWFSDWVLR